MSRPHPTSVSIRSATSGKRRAAQCARLASHTAFAPKEAGPGRASARAGGVLARSPTTSSIPSSRRAVWQTAAIKTHQRHRTCDVGASSRRDKSKEGRWGVVRRRRVVDDYMFGASAPHVKSARSRAGSMKPSENYSRCSSDLKKIARPVSANWPSVWPVGPRCLPTLMKHGEIGVKSDPLLNACGMLWHRRWFRRPMF